MKPVLTSLVFTHPPGKESKRPTASPDGVMTNENMLREYMASLEAKEDAKKDLNNTSTFANQVQWRFKDWTTITIWIPDKSIIWMVETHPVGG